MAWRDRVVGVGAIGLGFAFAAGCGGSVATPGGKGGGAGSGGGAGDACAPFADQKGPATVTVRIRNDSGVPIFLGGNCGADPFKITPAGGDDSLDYAFKSDCLQTCGVLQTDAQYYGCDCGIVAYRVETGASRDFTWMGTALRSGVAMPLACWDKPSGSNSTCGEVVPAAPGPYLVEATAQNSCPECACDAMGTCGGGPQGQFASATPATIAFPTTSLVELVFPLCAFGCAGSGGSGQI